jgi:plasmid rolling circle replication initiator protein Rep
VKKSCYDKHLALDKETKTPYSGMAEVHTSRGFKRMSTVGAVDLLTVPRGENEVKQDEYLSDADPRHTRWDQHRAEADEVRAAYSSSSEDHHQHYAERVEHCSQVLEFARDPPTNGKQKLKLKAAWFCRVRHCPVCQWRRSLMWQARVYKALPLIIANYPDTRFLFLTLTIRNCRVEDLRRTLDLLAHGWKRLTQLRTWPAIGWVRSVEITRGKKGSAHPHYHCLLMVPPTYFQGDYLKHHDWAGLWQQCVRIQYRPIVDIRVVRAEQRLPSGEVIPAPWNVWGAVVEILKYAVKPSDMVKEHRWFLTLVDQVHKTRAVAIGGVLKKYIREYEREDLVQEPGEEDPEETAKSLFFGWKKPVRRYKRLRQ